MDKSLLSCMTVNKITISLLIVLVVSIALFPLVWKPLDCKCPTKFSEENCQYANAYCWTRDLRDTDSVGQAWRDSVENVQFGQEFGPRVFVSFFVVAVLLLLPHYIKPESTIYLTAVFGTILAFLWLDFTLQTSFAKWGWHRFQQIWTHDSKTWHIFTQEKACNFKEPAVFYTVNAEDHEHTENSEDPEYTKNVDVLTLQCALTVNAWSEGMFLVLWVGLVLSGLFNFRKLVIAVFK
ncbi:hypothetical protein V1264_012154 [Littorina saxatilis]